MTPQDAKKARIAMAAMFASNGALMGAWAPQIPLLLPRHQIGETLLGGLILILGLGAVTSMLFTGRLIGRYGSVPVLRMFALAVIPVLPLVVLAPSLWTVALAMAIFGGFVGSMDVAMNANAVEVERRLGRAIMSSSHGFWSLGGFVGGTLGSFLIAQAGATTQALVIAALAAVMILTALPHLRGEPPQPQTSQAQPRGALLPRDTGLWLLGIMALFCMVPEGAVLDWAALYLGKELMASPFTAGLGFAFFSGAMAVMRFMGDGLRNRFGAVRTLQISGLLGAAGLVIAAAAPHPYVALFGFVLAGLGVANMVPIMFSAAGNYPGHAAGTAISTVTMVGYAGILIAPSSIGWLAEHLGYRPTYAGLALLLLVVTANAGRAARADELQKVSGPQAEKLA
ncbi:MFS transporter [Xinfangfangia sp. CPCC 101601]|uniref:MFS transporter n=1 Tax=Pseudogemmobacter lacusdianii TaxID=3069608 RepID=A0ABU0VSW6_9RHOB|nr:MFS transporter [Xinfangfangia sp. CPCC 101601]MDQ2064821.1 MFS transporter [Xinfangfangia sp. CPCC 101601]